MWSRCRMCLCPMEHRVAVPFPGRNFSGILTFLPLKYPYTYTPTVISTHVTLRYQVTVTLLFLIDYPNANC